MSNKTQLQLNNTKYASLIETLRGKSLPTGGEDVTEETNVYTEKIASLETAISALETELQGKASGGSGGGSVETCTVTITADANSLQGCSCTVMDNGKISANIFTGSSLSTPLTIENVLCNSCFLIAGIHALPGFSVTNATMENIVTIFGARVFKLVADTGSNVTIHYYNGD